MFVNGCRTEARTKIMAAYGRGANRDVGAEPSRGLVLHAAAKIGVSPSNTTRLIEDYRPRPRPRGYRRVIAPPFRGGEMSARAGLVIDGSRMDTFRVFGLCRRNSEKSDGTNKEIFDRPGDTQLGFSKLRWKTKNDFPSESEKPSWSCYQPAEFY